VRLVFLGSPPFATPVLERLAGSRFRPLLVVTQPARARGRGRKVSESPVVARAREHGIEVIEPPTVRDPDVLEQLRGLEPDVFLVVSYGEILRPEFLAIPRVVSLNVHPSLLPRWRGATPIPAALLAGDTVTGVSIQTVVKELDAGDVLLARETSIGPEENAGELTERLSAWSGELVLEALASVEDGSATYTPQDPAGVTHCKKLGKADGVLDWTRPATELANRVRAMTPWPGASTTLPGGVRLFVRRARVATDVQVGGAPGETLETSPRFLVRAGAGTALELLEVQAAGKRPLPAGDFLRGARLAPGERLG
jgi:methionyl-tRNA formyltransferase